MKKRITFNIALVLVGIYMMVGLLAPLMATKYPYKLKVNDTTYYPAFEHFLSFYHIKNATNLNRPDVLEALNESKKGGLIGFEPNYIDIGNTRSKPPGTRSQENQQIHYLGTDDSGRDLLSNLIHGAFTSLTIAFSSVFLSLLLALLLALPSSYMGDKTLNFTKINMAIFCLLMVLIAIMFFMVRPFSPIWDMSLGLRVLLFITYGVVLTKVFSTKRTSVKMISLPLDSIMMRIIEFMKSIPKLLILLVIIATSSSMSPGKLSLIIALLIWPTFYRYIRASILEQKHSTLYESLQNLGYSDLRILVHHFLPKSLRTIMIPFVFSLISVILFEATLSFLGIGLGSSHISWGKVLSEARNNMSAWWLAVFPGMVIFTLVISLNRIGDYLLEKWS